MQPPFQVKQNRKRSVDAEIRITVSKWKLAQLVLQFKICFHTTIFETFLSRL